MCATYPRALFGQARRRAPAARRARSRRAGLGRRRLADRSQIELLHVDALERVEGRPVQHLPLRAEARSVTRAVPALLRAVPAHDAAEVRANRRADVERTVVAAVDGELARAALDDRAGAPLDRVERRELAGLEPIAVAAGGRQIDARVLADRPDRLARRIVEVRPAVGLPEHEIADQHARDHPVGETVAGVAGGDEDALRVAR